MKIVEILKQKKLVVNQFPLFQSKIQNSNSKGFTLLELTIAMAIMGILSAVVISGYGNQRDTKALFLGENQIVNDIRNVQGRSYNILKVGASFPEGGYGISFSKDSNQYIIFANNNPAVNKTYDVGEEVETVELPRNVKVSGLKKDGVADVDNLVDIVFQPPYGKVFIDGDDKSGGNFIELEIEIEIGGNTKTVEMSSSRLIK